MRENHEQMMDRLRRFTLSIASESDLRPALEHVIDQVDLRPLADLTNPQVARVLVCTNPDCPNSFTGLIVTSRPIAGSFREWPAITCACGVEPRIVTIVGGTT